MTLQKIITTAALLCCTLMTISADDTTDLRWRLTGRLHMDGGVYNNAPKGVFSSVNITDMRLGAGVSVTDNWSASFAVGFANNMVSVKDAFIQYKQKDSYFRVGNILGPFGLNQSMSTNDLVFNTGANIAETLFGGRKLGLLYTYSSENHYIATGAFYGSSINNSAEINNGSNYTFRYVFRQQNHDQHLIHLGMSGSYRIPNLAPDPTGERESVRQVSLSSRGVTYLSSPAFIGANIYDAHSQSTIGLETFWVQQRFCAQAEYLHSWIVSPAMPTYFEVKGGYLQLSYLIKGDHYGYNMVDAIPMMPTDPNSIMISIRGNITQLRNGNIDYNRDAGLQRDIGIAAGFYFNRHISGRLNYSYIWLDEYSLLGEQDFGMLQARLQICF